MNSCPETADRGVPRRTISCCVSAASDVPQRLTQGSADQPVSLYVGQDFQNNSGLSQGRRGPDVGTLGSANGDCPRRDQGQTRREIMMHPHLPGPRPLAVPGIGFSQSISMGPQVDDPAVLGDLRPLTRAIERIFWVPSPQPWWMPVRKSV